MPNGEVEHYCFMTKEALEKARQPFYQDGNLGDHLNDALLLVLELSDINPRRRDDDKVFLSYSTNKSAIGIGYRGEQIHTPPDVDTDKVEDEIVDMLDQIVEIEPAEVYGDGRISQVVGAAHNKHQDELQDIVIVTPESHTHEVEGELVKQQLEDEIKVYTPREMHKRFSDDEECRID